jgi:hypothetical protein
MATRSRIGIENQDGSVTSIYCHWDGYPSGNGKTLVQHYRDRSKVEALIALGSISSLEESIECPEGHTYENPAKGCTVAYYRDRAGQSFIQQTDKSVGSYISSDLEDYGYLFTLNNKWVCICGRTRNEIPLNEMVVVHVITKAKIDIKQLEEVIEKTFGFHYDIYEKENALDDAEMEFNVAPHLKLDIDYDTSNPYSYDVELIKIRDGICPSNKSLFIILNELCEREQIEKGQYFI